jgi:hypothetical protein
MITIYPNFYTMTPYYVPIDTALSRIRSGRSAYLVQVAQEATDPKSYAKAKKKLPCIMFHGEFGQRAISGLIKHSGYICLDYDKFPNQSELETWRDTLEADEFTYSIFTSPSGMGLKRLVKIPQTDYKGHKAYFRALQAQYDCPYFDVNMFDVSRICFESYDQNLQINPDSPVWEQQIFDPEPVQVEYDKASLDEIETARRLMVWADRKFPIVAGARNANLFRLCCSFNDFGINYEHALSLCSQFQANDFKLGEIETTLKSAYRKTSKHGTLRF